MKLQEKIVLFKRLMQVSGAFTLAVTAILLINFTQLKRYEPLESETLNYLVEQLKDDPNNEQLMEEIRHFDLLVRKAYFTSEWQVRTGTYLLLLGAILFGIALKVHSDLKRRIEIPEADTENLISARNKASRWLLLTGSILFVLAVIAGFSSTNYLQNYYPSSMSEDLLPWEDDNIELVQIVDSTGKPVLEEGNVESVVATGEDTAAGNEGDNIAMDTQEVEENVPEEEVKEVVFAFEDFKKQHNSFRGPLALGVAYHTNIPVSWDGRAGSNVLWKVAISKPGYNSPVYWGNKLFIAGGDNEARIVSCYDKNTGQLLWEKKADNIPGSPSVMPKVTDDTGLSAPTMALDGYRAYAIFATGDIIAFDFNGNRIWARNLGVPKNHYGHSSSLIVWNGLVIIQYDTGSGGRMLALNGKSGETAWDVKRDNNISWASPILAEVNGKWQIITNTDPNVAGHDVNTGEELWKYAVMMGEVGPSCAYEDGLVFANNEYASLVALKPEKGDGPVWESYDFLSEAASPVAYNGLLFLATSYGVLACYDTKTGEEIWQKDFGVTLYSSPMVVEGKLYIMDNTGVMHIMKADRSGELIGEPSLGEASYAIPAFDNGRIYIRGAESLYCIAK